MAEMLLINPRRRRKTRRAAATTTRRRRVTRRRRNPMPAVARPLFARRRRTARRANPIARMRRRTMRRRNPIGGRMGTGMIMAAIREAFVGGAGAVAVDLAMGQINRYLPASLKTVPGTIGAGDAVKALITVTLGHLLARPTRGLSRKMALGALTVQSANIMKSFVPGTMAMGYASPARIVRGVNTVGPNMGAYTQGSPLLNAYTRSNVTPLLSANRSSAMSRESKYVFAR
ncbi:MAG: hypothetical protein EBZ75_13000 [Oxalobacteraceae bacterium]|nr:hypothetical protein [Oxalobacteraceae bacterium]